MTNEFRNTKKFERNDLIKIDENIKKRLSYMLEIRARRPVVKTKKCRLTGQRFFTRQLLTCYLQHLLISKLIRIIAIFISARNLIYRLSQKLNQVMFILAPSY